MPTRPKPFAVLTAEKRSHRTKEEMEMRKKGEEALTSGVKMKERPSTKANPIAHKEFTRINKLLTNIQKNDALYEASINRYAMLQAECEDFEEKRETFYRNLSKLEDIFSGGELTMEYFKTQSEMQSQILALDKQIMVKRKMLLDLEKENIMTIAAALRAIPKKPEDEEDDDPMAELLRRRRQG